MSLTIDVVVLNEPSSISKDVDSTLKAIVDFIPSNGGVAVGCDPHASILVGVDLILNKLTHAMFMDINATSLTIMDLTTYHSWVGLSLHLKASDAVVVDVIGLKVTLQGEDT